MYTWYVGLVLALAETIQYSLHPMPQAPGEAEAELAALNAIGEIDAVFSNDIRAFLFGAVTVIQRYIFLDLCCCHSCEANISIQG